MSLIKVCFHSVHKLYAVNFDLDIAEKLGWVDKISTVLLFLLFLNDVFSFYFS